MIPSPDEIIDSANERALESQKFDGSTIECANEHCRRRIAVVDAVPMGPQGLTGPYFCIGCAEGISEEMAKGSY